MIPEATRAAASALVLRPTSGHLVNLNVASPTAGWAIVVDEASPPASGAVTPKRAYYVPANGSVEVNYPERRSPQFTRGITVLFSSAANPFTYTPSAVAFIAGETQ